MTFWHSSSYIGERFPGILEPQQIGERIGYVLIQNGGILIEAITEDNVAEIDGEGIHSLNHRVREEAECRRHDYRRRHRDNDFRYVSRLQYDGLARYWFEASVTEQGDRALQCFTKHQCCDGEGFFHPGATAMYWLSTSENELLKHKNYFFSLDEEWALPIQERLMMVVLLQPDIYADA